MHSQSLQVFLDHSINRIQLKYLLLDNYDLDVNYARLNFFDLHAVDIRARWLGPFERRKKVFVLQSAVINTDCLPFISPPMASRIEFDFCS